MRVTVTGACNETKRLTVKFMSRHYVIVAMRAGRDFEVVFSVVDGSSVSRHTWWRLSPGSLATINRRLGCQRRALHR